MARLLRFLIVAVLVGGCSSNPSGQAVVAEPKKDLPAEVTGAPEDALPKKKLSTRR